VKSLVHLTSAPSVEHFKQTLSGRVDAIANANAVSVVNEAGRIELLKIVAKEIAPYGAKVSMEGPSVVLDNSSAQTIALALHELATNAAKYGSLSKQSGIVRIKWGEENSSLKLEWAETGGPLVVRPHATGFGTVLLERSIQQAGGKVVMDWQPTGLHCRMCLPLKK
jgi:two-component sensor histidine kinase